VAAAAKGKAGEAAEGQDKGSEERASRRVRVIPGEIQSRDNK
jgi:hypothetical protein